MAFAISHRHPGEILSLIVQAMMDEPQVFIANEACPDDGEEIPTR